MKKKKIYKKIVKLNKNVINDYFKNTIYYYLFL